LGEKREKKVEEGLKLLNGNGKMEIHERQVVLDQLVSSEARLLELVGGLTPEQWNFRETKERWSIAENIEHVIVVENFIMSAIDKVMQEPAQPDKKTQTGGKDSLVMRLGNTRGIKINARDAARPAGRWPETEEMILELRRTRARTVAFVAETQVDLRDYFFPHVAFGDLDCYQWLVVMAQHGARHALQIEEIKADPRYPVL
jgi:hypothetical protein